MEGSRQQRNVDLARRGMEAYNRGDIEALLELFSPEMELYSPPDFINAGVFHGPEGCVYMAIHPDRERALADIDRRGSA